ncbi:MAG: methionyl-tRNA formyltransferase [Pelagibacterales bacterium]|nr:methionyl-tRNA formyltransferase [Pelagibacterales bacterium]
MSQKIVFMGTSNFAVPILKSIYQNGFEIPVVYTQPPKKSNRGQKMNKSPVHLISETLNLDIRTPLTLLNNKEEINFLKDLNFDLAIVVAYGQIIPNDILAVSKKGFINIHASLLPKWRGAAPIQRAIMNLDSETGISIIKINEKLDTGPVSNFYKTRILDNENSEELSSRLSNLATEKILENIDEIFEDNANFIEQKESEATYAKKIEKLEGKIDWNDDAKKIIGKINGLYPSPGAWFLFNGERHKVLKAILSDSKDQAGMVLNENLEIACGNNSLRILEIQREGKKTQKTNEFILGTKIKKGSNLNNV